MGKSKRKNTSPLEKGSGKNRRTEEEDSILEVDEDRQDGNGNNEESIASLKEFIRSENARSNRVLTEDIRKYSEERITALESSLSFALAANETLGKRLAELEARAKQTESDFRLCLKRLIELEQEQDQRQQRELRDWLVFSGPAIPRPSRSNRSEDASRLLGTMLQQLMGFSMDMQQVAEMRRQERQISVRFTSCDAGSDRYLLVRNRTRLRGTGLYIRERLTHTRQQIFNKLMQLKREGKVSTVFTRDGDVHVVIGERDRPRPVRSDAALERLSREVAELAEASYSDRPTRGVPRADETTGASRSDGGLEMARSPPQDRDHVAARPAGAFADSSSGCAAGGAGRGAGRQVGAGPGGSAVRGEEEAELTRRRRYPSSPGSGDRPASERDRPLPGTRTNPSLDDHGADGGGYDGGGTGDGDGGERRGTDASSSQSAAAVTPQLATGTASVRRRCGADIRQFVTMHRKRD